MPLQWSTDEVSTQNHEVTDSDIQFNVTSHERLCNLIIQTTSILTFVMLKVFWYKNSKNTPKTC